MQLVLQVQQVRQAAQQPSIQVTQRLLQQQVKQQVMRKQHQQRLQTRVKNTGMRQQLHLVRVKNIKMLVKQIRSQVRQHQQRMPLIVRLQMQQKQGIVVLLVPQNQLQVRQHQRQPVRKHKHRPQHQMPQ
ncbi:hypothetical protein JK214_16040 [Lactiplantibacillus plantarum]|nr:hypothetical protein [Lactiplantibacillus plantarum]